MKVLITGGMGVIGSMVGCRFVQEGHRPVLMARHLDKGLIRPIEDQVDIELGDVLDLPRILSIIESYKITHIIHTAALIGLLSYKNPPQSIQINVIGALNILEAARFMKVQRVVYTSAKGVYGDITGEYDHPTCKPFDEDHPKNPIRIYESAKLMGEHIGQFYQRTYGLEFVALRFSQTYGPGKTVTKWGGRAIPSQIIEGAYSGKPVRVEKGGDQKSDFIYTKDVAHGIYLACTKPEIHYTAYNIGTGVGVTLKDFGEEVKRLIPEADIQIGPGLDYMGERRYGIFDITRAQQDLGFYPQFTLRKSVEDYIETLKRLGSQ
jgi:UDP-glucose 4-epimerase